MKKHWIIFDIIAICFVLCLGIEIGVIAESSRSQNQQQYRESISSVIAVVNEDMGAYSNDIKENYSAALIDKLGENYVLVSSQAAFNGYSNGSYGAIVTFPSNLSANVVSINNTDPEKVNLNYVINTNLPEELYIETYRKILDLQYETNQMISYMYVYSIYNEFHSAQSKINNIFQNDVADMDAADEVKLNDFTENLELGDVPRPPLETEYIDFNSFVESVRGYASNMSEEYLTSYDEAKEDYKVFGDHLIELAKTIENTASEWKAQLDSWKKNVLDYDDNVIKYGKDLTLWKDAAIDWHKMNDNWFEDLTDYYNTVEEYKELSDKFKKDAADFVDQTDEWGDKAESWVETILEKQSEREKEIKNAIKNYSDNYNIINTYKASLEDWEGNLNTYTKNMVEHPEEPVGPIPELELPNGFVIPSELSEINPWESPIFDEYPSVNDDEVSSFNTTLEAPPEFEGVKNMPEMPSEPERPVLQIPDEPEGFTDSVNEIVLKTHDYNPSDYLTPEVKTNVNNYVNDYSKHIYSVKESLDENVESNIDKLDIAYNEYNRYVYELKDKALACNNQEQQNLQDSMNIFYTQKTFTSNENRNLLGFFAEMMPESRRNSVMNKDVVEFTVAPVNFVDTNIRTSQKIQSFSQEKLLNYFKIVLIVLFGLMCCVLLYILLSFLFGRKKEE